jgi:hypothetical protein
MTCNVIYTCPMTGIRLSLSYRWYIPGIYLPYKQFPGFQMNLPVKQVNRDSHGPIPRVRVRKHPKVPSCGRNPAPSRAAPGPGDHRHRGGRWRFEIKRSPFYIVQEGSASPFLDVVRLRAKSDRNSDSVRFMALSSSGPVSDFKLNFWPEIVTPATHHASDSCSTERDQYSDSDIF